MAWQEEMLLIHLEDKARGTRVWKGRDGASCAGSERTTTVVVVRLGKLTGNGVPESRCVTGTTRTAQQYEATGTGTGIT